MYFSHSQPFGRLLEINSNNYFLSGHPALRTISIKSFPSHDVRTMLLSTILGGRIYSIAYGAIAERSPDYLRSAQAMIDSFQIINKQ